MRKQLSAVAIAVACTFAFASHAMAGEQEAYVGTAADAVTTGAALASPGFTEANPLGWATVPIRMALIERAKALPREEGQPLMDAVSASSWGATANNLLMLAGASSVAPVIGIAIGYAVWKKGETEREFWHMCAVHQKIEPGVKCQFRAWKAEDVMRIAQEQQTQRVAAAQVSMSMPTLVNVSASATTQPVMAPMISGL
jgi:hypothetical protein